MSFASRLLFPASEAVTQNHLGCPRRGQLITVVMDVYTCVWRITNFPRISNSPHTGKNSNVYRAYGIVSSHNCHNSLKVAIEFSRADPFVSLVWNFGPVICPVDMS